jgi:hypothetical protein
MELSAMIGECNDWRQGIIDKCRYGDPMASESGIPEHVDLFDLKRWISVWYDQAVAARFIHPPFVLDDHTADRLQGYFEAGLTPGDAVHAFFGMMH